MGFRIEPGQSVGDEFRRIAAEQLEGAIAGLRQPDEGAGLAAAVHDARKRCKRLRALFRLVRPSIPARRYRSLDTVVRDAARELSASRDAQALVDMFDDLVAAHGADRASPTLAAVRAGLSDRVAALPSEASEAGAPLLRARERLDIAREAAAATKLNAEGFKALRDGLASVYGDGRQALGKLRRDGSAEQSHEWRKAVKYTWHHLELLERTAPSILEPAAQCFHRLSDALGDAHNLVVLVEVLEPAPARFGGRATIQPVLALARASRADLEQRAIRLGLRMYAEAPDAFAQRLHGYWRAERTGGDELPTGELADVAAPGEAEESAVPLLVRIPPG